MLENTDLECSTYKNPETNILAKWYKEVCNLGAAFQQDYQPG